ncbi:MAG: iron-containing alcohol dehydrogenase family protein [Cyanobacteria bacterium P01_A01_bin.3]
MVPLPSQEPALIPAPGVVSRGWGIAAERATDIVRIARAASARAASASDRQAARIFTIGGDRTLSLVRSVLAPAFDTLAIEDNSLVCEWTTYGLDCCEADLERLREAARDFAATAIVGVGGGKALDTAKLIAHQLQLPVVTIPTSAATCAAWTALSNVYSDTGAFQYDVPLDRAPDLLILDYQFVRQAPLHTLKAGIGDALAKWYEASVSSGGSEDVLTIAAVQQARVLRDLLLQKSAEAIACPGGTAWVQVVDASVCLAGVMGGLGGAKCRTVAAHAVHNGLTHLVGHKSQLHGAKVAFGILVQLRLEEILQGRQLAATARQQLLQFYDTIGLPTSLEELRIAALTGRDSIGQSLAAAAQVACAPTSDIHHLPFAVTPEALMVAMTTTRLEFSAERPVLSAP